MSKKPISIKPMSDGYRVTINVDWDTSFSYHVNEEDLMRKRLIHLDVKDADVKRFITDWRAILLRLEDDLSTDTLVKKLINPLKKELLKDRATQYSSVKRKIDQ